MNRDAMEALIPHRPPFLLLDEVLEVSGDRLRARSTVRPHAEPWAHVLPGHYPGDPIVPGVLLCEMIFQAGALLMGSRISEADTVDTSTSDPGGAASAGAAEATGTAGTAGATDTAGRGSGGQGSLPVGGVPVLTRIRDAKFRRVVRAGEPIDLEVIFEDQVSNAIYMKGKALVEGKAAVQVAFACALVEH